MRKANAIKVRYLTSLKWAGVRHQLLVFRDPRELQQAVHATDLQVD